MREKTTTIEDDAGDQSVLAGDGMGCVHPSISFGTVIRYPPPSAALLSATSRTISLSNQ